jgi:probable rRNA maturation factor
MPAKFYEQGVSAGLKNKRKLSAFLDQLLLSYLKKAKTVELTYIFCDDDYLLTINQQFLQHDTLTDIITFDLSETKEALQGEIYISVDRVKENAGLFKVSYADELHRVILHGALHLCGFKDKKPAEEKKMREMETLNLNEYKKELAK